MDDTSSPVVLPVAVRLVRSRYFVIGYVATCSVDAR